MKRVIAVLAVLGVVLACSPAFAAVLTFGDNSTSWGKWGIPPALISNLGATPWNVPPPSGVANTVDEYGDPIFNINNTTAGENKADITAGKLHALTIAYHNVGGSYWEISKPGDVFIDKGGDGTWDFVLRTPFFANLAYFDSTGTPTTAGATALAAPWEVYSLSGLPYWNDQDVTGNPGGPFQLAGEATRADTGISWSGFSIRNYHPWALDSVSGLTKVADATLTGARFDGATPDGTWDTSKGWVNLDGMAATWRGESKWTFDKDLFVGYTNQTVVFGFTVNCANDVLLGGVPVPLGMPVPEPTSLAIWSIVAGLGAAGATAARRRRTAGRGRWSSENRQAILEIIERSRRG